VHQTEYRAGKLYHGGNAMLFRPICCFALLAISSQPLAAQRPSAGSQDRTPTEVIIRVTDENGRPMGRLIKVQILGGGGSQIAEQVTDDQGTARLPLRPGQYRVRVTHPDIEDVSPERSFVLYPRQPAHYEFVQVTRKRSDEAATQPHISAKALAVPEKARKQQVKGLSALAEGSLDEAERHLLRAIEIYPDYAEAYNGLGVVAMKRGDAITGRTWFEQAIQIDPDSAGGYINLARLHMNEQAFAQSEELLTKALTLAPLDAEAISMQAYVLMRQGKLDAAVAAAQRVHSLPHANLAMVHSVAAYALRKQQRHQEAAAEYRLFIKESPPGPSVERAKAELASLPAVSR
jgi:tetratricopeptide (TPR) repeat protein